MTSEGGAMTITKKTVMADVRVKDADQGIVSLVFSTFNKVDKDGDVTLKGAFTGNPAVVLSAYGHKSWEGALPYGSGTIAEGEKEAVADVQFLLNTTHGRDAFEIVKHLSEKGLQEWSYSLEGVESEKGTVDGKSVRILKKIFVKEISPVLRGAGSDTRTLDVKADDATPTKFSEHFDIALRGVKQLAEMAVERLTLRAAEGKSITEQTEAYDQLMAAIAPLKTAIDETGTAPADATQTTPNDELARIYLAFVATSQGANP